MNPNPRSIQAIAELGERIYKEYFQQRYEAKHHGKFVAVNVHTKDAFLGDTPDEALERGCDAGSKGMFHLIRVGFASAFSKIPT